VYENWKQTIEDIKSAEFVVWIKETLGLAAIAEKMKSIAEQSKLSDCVVNFLRLTDFYTGAEISAVIRDLDAWEKRLDWERLKERGDYLMQKSAPEKALVFYKNAMRYGSRAELLNNMAVAFMRMGRFTEAVTLLREALTNDPDNSDLILNYAEACAYADDVNEASRVINLAKAHPNKLASIKGEIFLREGNMSEARTQFVRAATDGTIESILRLVDFYIGESDYTKAEAALNRISAFNNTRVSVKRAELLAEQKRYGEAISLLEYALASHPSSIDLWLCLSEASRLSGDVSRAMEAAGQAVALEPYSPRASLEMIKVRRAANQSREYLRELQSLILSLKDKYRDALNDSAG
jgi:tetratricopeptide (TPR) repeat protein